MLALETGPSLNSDRLIEIKYRIKEIHIESGREATIVFSCTAISDKPKLELVDIFRNLSKQIIQAKIPKEEMERFTFGETASLENFSVNSATNENCFEKKLTILNGASSQEDLRFSQPRQPSNIVFTMFLAYLAKKVSGKDVHLNYMYMPFFRIQATDIEQKIAANYPYIIEMQKFAKEENIHLDINKTFMEEVLYYYENNKVHEETFITSTVTRIIIGSRDKEPEACIEIKYALGGQYHNVLQSSNLNAYLNYLISQNGFLSKNNFNIRQAFESISTPDEGPFEATTIISITANKDTSHLKEFLNFVNILVFQLHLKTMHTSLFLDSLPNKVSCCDKLLPLVNRGLPELRTFCEQHRIDLKNGDLHLQALELIETTEENQNKDSLQLKR